MQATGPDAASMEALYRVIDAAPNDKAFLYKIFADSLALPVAKELAAAESKRADGESKRADAESKRADDSSAAAKEVATSASRCADSLQSQLAQSQLELVTFKTKTYAMLLSRQIAEGALLLLGYITLGQSPTRTRGFAEFVLKNLVDYKPDKNGVPCDVNGTGTKQRLIFELKHACDKDLCGRLGYSESAVAKDLVLNLYSSWSTPYHDHQGVLTGHTPMLYVGGDGIAGISRFIFMAHVQQKALDKNSLLMNADMACVEMGRGAIGSINDYRIRVGVSRPTGTGMPLTYNFTQGSTQSATDALARLVR